MCEKDKDIDPAIKVQILVAALAEQGAAMRARAQGEFVLAGAAVASFVLLIVGVAQTSPPKLFLIVVFVWSVLIGGFVSKKIKSDHKKYKKYFTAYRNIYTQLKDDYGVRNLPDIRGKGGAGYKDTISIVLVSACVPALFSVANWFHLLP